MSELDDFKATYFDECSELLLELEEQFRAIAEGERHPSRLNAVFRAIHSIKGGGGAFGFEALVGFAHAFESQLDHVREGRIELGEEVVALSIRAVDIVADFVAAARSGTVLPADHGRAERERFEALVGSGGADEPIEEFDIDFTPVPVVIEKAELSAIDRAAPGEGAEAAPAPGGWLVRFRPFPALYERANDPLLLLRELDRLGRTEIVADLDPIPPLAAFEACGVYAGWSVFLRDTEASEAEVREVFEFVEGDCTLEIAALPAALDDAPADPEDVFPDEPLSLFDLAEIAQAERNFVADGAPDPVGPAAAPAAPRSARPAPVEEGAGSVSRGGGAASIRVDLDKVDRVVNMVGELVITQSMLTQQMDDAIRDRYQELVRGIEVLAQTTRELQDAVMAIRAQPVKSVFSRMPRLVRELAGKTDKKIRLETVGEATEIDKTVIEQLSDPLTHMVRNSADHGVEAPAARQALGKPETGTIRLSAEQAGGNILIVVEDDGAGIDRARVLAIARERGLVGPDQAPTDEQIDQLIFAPGFSTATEVSDISGRGVGMDVVLSNIKKIGGSVHVRSHPGKGTRMTLRLPLTLAVLDVMLVRVGGCPYVIPLSSIVETMQNARADFGHMPSGGRVLQTRGAYVPVVDLASQFGLERQTRDQSRFVVLCEAEGDGRVALVVDEIVGQQQVVIKSLEENFERIEGIAGGTILGDGNVALIVDVQNLRTDAPHQSAA